MSKPSFFDNVRDWLSGIAFAVYLCLMKMSKEDFWREQERQAIEHIIVADGLTADEFYCHCPSCNATGHMYLFIRRR